MALDDGTPSLPPSRTIELPGRGSTTIRELPAPAGAPTVLLLHGWTATSDLNWFTCYAALGRRYGVLALDHRGHGSGIRSTTVFRLEDCADDAAVLAGELGIESLIAVGYSMGGPVALLLARQWPALVQGLVLCASAASFSTTRQDRFGFLALGALARASRLTPVPARTWLNDQYVDRRARRYELWARRQVQLNDPTAMLEAGAAIGAFAAEPWLDMIRVPAAQIITSQDHVVSLARQERLAEALPDVEVSRIDADHDVCVARPDDFVPLLVAACASVAARAGLEGDLAEGA
jgi:3-oxoadipate enol-lactonase